MSAVVYACVLACVVWAIMHIVAAERTHTDILLAMGRGHTQSKQRRQQPWDAFARHTHKRARQVCTTIQIHMLSACALSHWTHWTHICTCYQRTSSSSSSNGCVSTRAAAQPSPFSHQSREKEVWRGGGLQQNVRYLATFAFEPAHKHVHACIIAYFQFNCASTRVRVRVRFLRPFVCAVACSRAHTQTHKYTHSHTHTHSRASVRAESVRFVRLHKICNAIIMRTLVCALRRFAAVCA